MGSVRVLAAEPFSDDLCNRTKGKPILAKILMSAMSMENLEKNAESVGSRDASMPG